MEKARSEGLYLVCCSSKNAAVVLKGTLSLTLIYFEQRAAYLLFPVPLCPPTGHQVSGDGMGPASCQRLIWHTLPAQLKARF